MKDWGEATTTVGIITQIVNQGGNVEFDNRNGKVSARVGSRAHYRYVRQPITGMNEPEIVKALWSAWEKVR